MSHTANQILSNWRVVEAELSRHKSFCYHEEGLSKRMVSLVKDSYLLWYWATYDTLQSDGQSNFNDVSWLHFICGLNVEEVGRSLKDTDSFLLRNECVSYDDLKHHLRGTYPFIGRLLSPMKQIIVRWYDTHSIPHFSLFHSWLCFIGRVNITCDHLANQALEEYLALEDSLELECYTQEESSVLAEWYPRSFGYYFKDMVHPQHGNGSTADVGKNMLDKYLAYSDDVRLRYVARDLAPCRVQSEQLDRCCRLQFVPKSLTGYRSISMEPSSLMWVQQGVQRAFADYQISHKYLRRRFRADDQEPNRSLAWLGSIDGSFATIDLSSASDSVSWKLVRQWFSKTFLFPWQLCTRSLSVQLPDGSRMGLRKYAPMGSSLCFPTETSVFCAITECAIRECGGSPDASQYRVYGDDIVVEAPYAEAVVARLERNGFTVNKKKTFLSTSPEFTFRESCGGEYLNGADVTPTRLSRKFSGLSVHYSDPSQVENLIELANDCFSRYPTVRRRIIHSLMVLPKRMRPLFNSSGDGGIFSPEPTNWHLSPLRWSDDFQLYTCEHGYNRPRRKSLGFEADRVEDIRLFEYLRQVDGRKRLLYPEDKVIVDLRRHEAGIWAVTSSPAEWITPFEEITP